MLSKYIDLWSSVLILSRYQSESAFETTMTAKLQDIIDCVTTAGHADQLSDLLSDEKYRKILNNCDNQDGYSPLIWAAKHGHENIVDILCSCDELDINLAGGWNGTTALMKAVVNRHPKVVKTLIDNGAELNKTNEAKMTALMLAAQNPDPLSAEIAALLLANNKVDINLKNVNGFTALILAAEVGANEIVTHIANHPKFPETVELGNMFGKTAFFMGAECGKLDVLKIIRERCPSDRLLSVVNHKSKRELPGLALAAVKKHREVVDYLLEIPGIEMDGAVELACSGGDHAIVKQLIGRAGPDKKKFLMKWLSSACAGGHNHIVKELVKQCEPQQDYHECLVGACESGHIDVVITLLNKIYSEVSHSHDAKTIIETTHLNKNDKEGNSALRLLANYCRENRKKLLDIENEEGVAEKGFLSKCIENNVSQPFLLDMLPYILPATKSPNTLMNLQKEKMILGLRALSGREADIQLVGALVNIAAALKLSAIAHQEEFRDLENLSSAFEDVLVECMNCPSMDSPANVTKVLRRRDDNLDNELPEVVQKAYTIQSGPLDQCAVYNLTKIFSTPQIIRHVRDVFYSSLKPKRVDIVRTMVDLFQLRTECSTIRFRPNVLFLFEGGSKLLASCVVYLALNSDSGDEKHEQKCILDSSVYVGVWFQPRWYLVLLLITSVLYEVGEVNSKDPCTGCTTLWEMVCQGFFAFYQHISGQWNLIDCIALLCWSFWAPCPFGIGDASYARGWLAVSAIPLAFSLLRFLSISKATGQLVIMVFEMMKDLISFIQVFCTCIVGFGITFHGLLANSGSNKADSADHPKGENHSFDSLLSTIFTLFDAAVGNHEFKWVMGESYELIGIVLLGVFVVFACVLLVNLIVARMSATHDKIDERSLEVWSKMQAVNVQDFALLRERSSLCMLPPPLNAISSGVGLLDHMAVIPGFRQLASGESAEGKSLFASRASDCITSLIFSLPCAICEVYWANEAIWGLSVPREVALTVTVAGVLYFPIWVTVYWFMILWSICFLESPTLIDPIRRTIKFNTELKQAMKVDENVLVPLFLLSGVLVQAAVNAVIAYCDRPDNDWVTTSVTWFFRLWVEPSFYLHSIPLLVFHLDPELKKGRIFGPTWQFIETVVKTKEDPNAKQQSPGPKPNSRHLYAGYLLHCGIFSPCIGLVQLHTGLSATHLHCVAFVVSAVVYGSCFFAFKKSGKEAAAQQRLVNASAPKIGSASAPELEPEPEAISPRSEHQKKTALKRMGSARKIGNTPVSKDGSAFGAIAINLIRANLETCGEGYFGRKVNPYVMITFGDDSDPWFTKPVLKGGKSPSFNANCTLTRKGDHDNSILFEVFDKGDVDEDTIRHDKLLCSVNVPIKDWLSNQFFMGFINLYDEHNRKLADFLQLDVKVTFPHGDHAALVQYRSLSTDSSDQRDVEEKAKATGVLFTDKDRKSMFKKILESQCDIKEDSPDRSDVTMGGASSNEPQNQAAAGGASSNEPKDQAVPNIRIWPSSDSNQSTPRVDLVSPQMTPRRRPLDSPRSVRWEDSPRNGNSGVAIEEDSRVEANFQGSGSWYAGTVTCVRDDGTYDVLYDDGDFEARVDLARIRPLHVGSVGEGARVQANHLGSGCWYPGTVVCVRDDGTYDVRYDDGEFEKRVDIQHIQLLSTSTVAEEEVEEPLLAVEEGTKVEANYRGQGRWYGGTITCARADGTYDVLYDDGDYEPRVDLVRIKLQHP